MQSLRRNLALDVLDDLLRSLRIQSAVFGRTIARGPWGLSVNARADASYTLVVSGSGWLSVEGVAEPLRLNAGDAAVFPHGHAHAFRDALSSRSVPLVELLKSNPPSAGDSTIRFGGDGDETVFLCGGFGLEERKANPLLLALPPVIRISQQDRMLNPSLHELLRAIEAEGTNCGPGSNTIMARSAELLLIHAIRIYAERAEDEGTQWLPALTDLHISRALAVMHRQPEDPWSVSRLAATTGLSRSAFARKFAALVGDSPMRYLARLRINKAAALLKRNSGKLLDVAEAVGYQSEASFCKAFKRWVGVTPGAHRRTYVDPLAIARSGEADRQPLR